MQNNEITVMNLDCQNGPPNSVFGQEQLQLQEEEQTGMKLFSIQNHMKSMHMKD
jgi:hypothetical protein